MEKETKGISKYGLVALVVSSSIGGGVFGITKDLANVASPGAGILAWLIVGVGILALVLSLNNLADKRPDLDSGIFGYAEAVFGKIGGFISGWGYWLSAWLGNVAFATILMSAIGGFFPMFEGGQNIPSIIVASIFIWALTLLVNRGIESASFINVVVTIGKLIPLFLFLIIIIVSFKAGVFTSDFWGNVSSNVIKDQTLSINVWDQVKASLLIMMWVFVGIEGASVLANRAKKRSDAQRASIIGLAMLLTIYVLASLLPYGVLNQAELAEMQQPAMANILKTIVGDWGATLINIGLIISIAGAWLSWTMLPAETTMLMARDGILPKSWGKLNASKAPTYSLFMTAILTNGFLFTFLFTDYAYKFAYSLCTAAILICYLLVGIYQVKYSFEKKDHKNLLIGIIAVTFQLMGIFLAGFSYVLMCSIAYLPGFALYIKTRHDAGEKITQKEIITMITVSIIAIIAIVMMVTGVIQIG
ncbi:MAG: arginine-ornithine antiporter [Culicoidibacterales bacterium]